ncbi:MAG: NlpC/P60 family protein [Dermabacter sp.]|nr:NlpC/P60 family protein [Dermabacter sp.]
MSNRLTKTHRRPMRPVTPVTRASRGAAGVAIAATFVISGSSSALADGTTSADAKADASAATVITPAATPAVEIPAANADTDAAFGAVVTQSATLKAKAPAPVARQAEATTASTSTSTPASTSSTSAASSSSSNEQASTGATEQAASAPRSVVAGDSILATARNGIGSPYVMGGTSPSGWDCSGFVQWVYKQHGINLPRTDSAQAAYATRIPASEARPGDLVQKPGHIGIYAGNGMFVDAGNSRVGTTERKIYSGNWSYYRVNG